MLTKDIDSLFERIKAYLNDFDGVEGTEFLDWDALRHDLEKWPLGEPDN